MGNRPTSNDSIVNFAFLYPNYELSGTLTYSFFQIIKELLCVLTEINVNPLSFGLEDAVFVNQNESHFI